MKDIMKVWKVKTRTWENEARRLFKPYAEELGFDERDWAVFLVRLEHIILNSRGGAYDAPSK